MREAEVAVFNTWWWYASIVHDAPKSMQQPGASKRGDVMFDLTLLVHSASSYPNQFNRLPVRMVTLPPWRGCWRSYVSTSRKRVCIKVQMEASQKKEGPDCCCATNSLDGDTSVPLPDFDTNPHLLASVGNQSSEIPGTLAVGLATHVSRSNQTCNPP